MYGVRIRAQGQPGGRGSGKRPAPSEKAYRDIYIPTQNYFSSPPTKEAVGDVKILSLKNFKRIGESMADNWKEQVEKLRYIDGKSWAEIAHEMQNSFPELSLMQVREKCRDHCRGLKAYKDKEDKPVLVFSDIHAPFDHKRYPDFLRDTYKRFGCGRVICLGDLVDNHAISGHMTEPCALGAYTELDLAISRLKIYTAIFPDVDYCKGNHDLRVDRMAASVGIGRRYLRDFQEVLELPKGWVCHGDEFIANGILYSHGVDAAGKNGAINKALRERMSVAVGHSHAYGGCQQSANKRDAVFGLNVGCGIDDEAYAFVYGKHSRNRVTLGCGVVFSPEQAIFVPMGKEYS